VENFKGAIVYGKSVKHQPQRVGLAHELDDEDVGKCCLQFASLISETVLERGEHA
jgi:ribosome-interacting GTPase 1